MTEQRNYYTQLEVPKLKQKLKSLLQELKLSYYTSPHSETKMNTQWEALKNPQ